MITQMHRLPATWLPVGYQDWTSISKKTMTFQDTRAGVSPFLAILNLCLFVFSNFYHIKI
jgi:hypothetical protein